jgi:lysophospholipase L1-like esterase
LRGFADQTLRQILVPSVGGSQVRVRLTNAYGTRPIRIGQAAIAVDRGGARVAQDGGVPLYFAGGRSVTIPPGGEATTQPVRFSVKPMQGLEVSIFLAAPTGPATVHNLAEQVNYVAPGDRVLDPTSTPFTSRASSWFFLDGVSVLASTRVQGTIVAFGDSITDGFRSTLDANARWPNDLARRLNGKRGPTLSVVDAGIAGNRVLTNSRCFGVSAVARFRRDVLDQPGVHDVILLEGTNDIGMGHTTGWCSAPHRAVSAAQIIAGYEQIIRQAHQAGLRIFGGTLIPFGGAAYWTPAGEAERETINRWIRTSGAFDGVIDFAAALADPRDPRVIDPRYDSGDHLHPNDAGYRAMANAIDAAMLLHPALR